MKLSTWVGLLQVTASMGLLPVVRRRARTELEVLSVSDRIQRMAETLPDGTTKSLLHSFKVCGQCQDFKRFGEAHDGGYLTCMDGVSNGHVKAAYSMGVNTQDQWSLDMYKLLKVPVNQFDCTNHQGAQQCSTCQLFEVCIQAQSGAGSVPGHRNWALQEVLNSTGMGSVPDRSLVMKMDIEGSEWPILAEMAPGGAGNVLKKFQQLIFEFHWMDKKSKHDQYLKAMQNLLAAGFRVAHVHGNNYGGMYREGDYEIPTVVEVTFVSSGQPLATCQDPAYSPLDAVNNPSSHVDLPSARLPF